MATGHSCKSMQYKYIELRNMSNEQSIFKYRLCNAKRVVKNVLISWYADVDAFSQQCSRIHIERKPSLWDAVPYITCYKLVTLLWPCPLSKEVNNNGKEVTVLFVSDFRARLPWGTSLIMGEASLYNKLSQATIYVGATIYVATPPNDNACWGPFSPPTRTFHILHHKSSAGNFF